MHDALRHHVHGITMEFPEHWTLIEADDKHLRFQDDKHALGWQILWGAELHLDLRAESRAHLERKMALHAQDMWAKTHEAIDQPLLSCVNPDTWTPMVDVEDITVHGVQALRTIHRMAYSESIEYILGHILIPLEGGLMEIRVSAQEPNETGQRERWLFAQFDDPTSLPPQSYYDDARHDERFSELVLSRTRRALDRVMPYITACTAAPKARHKTITREDPDCTFTPPPRFIEDTQGYVDRVSFCVTDGIESFHLLEGTQKSNMEDLHELIVRATVPIYYSPDMPKIHVHTDVEQDRYISAIVTNDGDDLLIRDVYLGYLDAQDTAWVLGITRDKLSPQEELIQELIHVTHTLKPARKKWLGLF